MASDERDRISVDLSELSYSQVRDLDKNAADGKALEYYESAQINGASVYRNKISGRVGNFFEEFVVELTVHGKEISSSCTCSQSREICRHAVALLYAWVNDGGDFMNIGRVLDEIETMDKIRLVEIISNIIRVNPRFADVFLAKHNPEWDEIDMDLNV
jgi:hypothetical protein